VGAGGERYGDGKGVEVQLESSSQLPRSAGDVGGMLRLASTSRWSAYTERGLGRR